MLTDKRKEKISAFLDDDMHRDELMSFSLSSEDEDAEVAQRYQMVGDALRGELSDASFVDVSKAVREALADEELPLAEPAAASTTATPPPRQSTTRWDISSWFRPVAGMAAAVLVAVVVVISVNEQQAGLSPVAENSLQPATQQAVEVQLAAEDRAAQKPVTTDAEADQRLIDQHLEYATQDAMQGRLPYVRAVSFKRNGGNPAAGAR